ncbi:MAG: hypothetical protein JSS83_15040 [Cyanobacteria bacterium SZAS LIN-3]|nr:hypothetical protein [Cyanobacteria bacterium SZAS LIN-3]
MAGPGSDSKSTEDKTASDLIGGKPHQTTTETADMSPYITPGMPKGNANAPGARETHADTQAGGPANPDRAASTAATDAHPTKPATTAADAPARTQTDTTAAARTNTDRTATAGTDRTTTTDNTAGAKTRPEAFQVMKQVNDILDKEVPGLNKAHDLEGAKKAYERAIALAKTLTPDDIAKAQAELAQVRKDKAAEQDPTKQRDLANKEVDLYTITRLKDAALGNMALWYYRQGKAPEGNAKLLEAAGVPEAQANQLKAMGPQETVAFGELLKNSTSLSPILGDVNFYRQLNKIKEGGSPVPEIFGQINQAVIAHNAEVARAQTGGDGRTQATAGTDNRAAAAGADANGDIKFDKATTDAAAKATTDVNAFINLTKGLKDKPAPIGDLSPADRKVIDDGLAGIDLLNKLNGQMMDAKQKALDAVVPKDKQQALGVASDAISADLKKVADANSGKLPPELQTSIAAVMNANSPDAFNTAAANLAKVNPDLAKHIQDAVSVLPADKAAGMAALRLYNQNTDLQSNYVTSSMQQIAAHYQAADILMRLKTPPADADKTHAKEVFQSGFVGVPPAVSEQALADPNVQKLAKDLGFQPAANPAAASDRTATTDATGTPTSSNPNDLSNLSPQDLNARLDAAIAKKGAGLNEAKALFEEEIRRAEEPTRRKQWADQVADNLKALEANKGPDGKPLDANARLQLNAMNAQLILGLNAAAQLHNQYATYLGDNRLTALDPSKAHAQITDGVNQIKSMDEQQRKAIAAADSVDINLMKRVAAQINQDRSAGVGDTETLTQLKVLVEGGKDAKGDVHPNLLTSRVFMRDQLAMLYLMQGAQFNDKGNALQLMPKTHQTDEMFRPQDALKLLTEAKAANEAINGAGSHDAVTEQLFAMGQQLRPEMFKNASDKLRESASSGIADVGALVSSVAGGAVLKFAVAAATEGKVNPFVLNRIGDVGAVTTGIITRHYLASALNGKEESWSDSAVHGGIAALMPIGYKYGSQLLNKPGAASAFEYRMGNITGEGVLNRVAGNLGENATFSQVGRVFRNSGLTNEAAQLEALGNKAVSSATAEELAALNKSLNLNGARGATALERIFPHMNDASTEAKTLSALNGRGINTVGDLQANLATRAERVTSMGPQLNEASIAKLNDSAPVTDALRKMRATGDPSKAAFSGELAVSEQAKFLAENNIKTVGQLRAAVANAKDYFTVGKLFPDLAGLAPETKLAEALAAGKGFGAVESAGRVQLRNIVPEVNPAVPNVSKGVLGRFGSWVDGKAGSLGDVLYGKRSYNIDVRNVVSFPNAGKPASELVAVESPGGVKGALNRFKPEFNAPKAPNLQRLDAATASQRELQIANNQSAGWKSTTLALGTIGAYNTTTSLYDNWWKGKSYQDAQGNWHQFTAMDAVMQGNFGPADKGVLNGLVTGTVGQALLGGWILKGAMAPALEEAAAASGGSGWLARKIPQFGSQYARDAIAGTGRDLSTWTKFGLATPNAAQGAMDYFSAQDNQRTYESTQRPLRDYAPQNAGTTADQVYEQQGAKPHQPATTDAPATTTDAPATTAAPAGSDVIDPNAGAASTTDTTTAPQTTAPATGTQPSANPGLDQKPPGT